MRLAMPHAPRASAASASAVLVVVLVLVLVGVAVAAVLVVVLPVVVLVGRTQRTQRERRLAGGRCWNGCPRAVVAGQSLRWECQRRSARRHRGGHLGWHVERPLLCQCRQRQESRDGHGRGHCRGQQQPGRSFIAEFFFPFFFTLRKKKLARTVPVVVRSNLFGKSALCTLELVPCLAAGKLLGLPGLLPSTPALLPVSRGERALLQWVLVQRSQWVAGGVGPPPIGESPAR